MHHTYKDAELQGLNVLFLSLSDIFQGLFSIYIPTINAIITKSMAQTFDETKLNMLMF